MKKKVTVTISGREYTMLAAEDDLYVQKCAAHVDAQLRLVSGERLSLTDAAVLTAMNIADQYFSEQTAAENLRRQIKENLEEINRLNDELSQAKREIFRLQSRKN